MMSLWQIAVSIHNLAGPFVMLAYPLYASVKAIESPLMEDNAQWLTYWVLYSFFQLVELSLESFFQWVPLWYTVKLLAFSWLTLPRFQGAAFLYEHFVQKYIGGSNVGRTLKLTPGQRQLIVQMSAEARVSISSFISEHGPGAFDSVMHTVWTFILHPLILMDLEARRRTRHLRSSLPAQASTRVGGLLSDFVSESPGN